MPTFPKIITLTIAYEVFEGGFTPYCKDAARMPSLAIKNKLIKGTGPVRIHEYLASMHSRRFSSANRATLSSYRVISGRVNTNYSHVLGVTTFS